VGCLYNLFRIDASKESPFWEPIGGAILELKVLNVTCNTCKIPMRELKGHIYHKKRKWKCRKCGRVRMQEQKST
jgi:hypothetical protein